MTIRHDEGLFAKWKWIIKVFHLVFAFSELRKRGVPPWGVHLGWTRWRKWTGTGTPGVILRKYIRISVSFCFSQSISVLVPFPLFALVSMLYHKNIKRSLENWSPCTRQSDALVFWPGGFCILSIPHLWPWSGALVLSKSSSIDSAGVAC